MKRDMKCDVMEEKQFDSWEECLYDLLVNGKDLIREEAMKGWRMEGREEGRAEGREQGARDLLLRLLARRAELVAPEWAQRIGEAGKAELEDWLERLYDGAHPSELFAAPAPGR